jgi:hypothetical protein
MRDQTNDLEVRCASPWDKRISFAGSLRTATHQHQRGRRRPIGECPPTGFGRRCLQDSVRFSSSAPSEYRQRIPITQVILKMLKISTKYVDNSVENSKPMRSDRCPRLSFLNICLKFGQLLTCLIYFDLSYSTVNFSRGNTYPSNFNRFHSIVIPPVNKSPRGPDLPGHWRKIQNLVQLQGFPMDGGVHLTDGLASVQTFLKRCQTSIKLTYLMQSRGSVVDIFGIEIRFRN